MGRLKVKRMKGLGSNGNGPGTSLEKRRADLSREFRGVVTEIARHQQMVSALAAHREQVSGRYAEICEMLGIPKNADGGYPLLDPEPATTAAPTDPAPQPEPAAAPSAEA